MKADPQVEGQTAPPLRLYPPSLQNPRHSGELFENCGQSELS